MKFRNLRIAWSAAWSVLTVLIIVLWARSFTYNDSISGPISETKLLHLGSLAGGTQIRLDDRQWRNPNSFHWQIKSTEVAELNNFLADLNRMHAQIGPSQPNRVNMTMEIGWKRSTLFVPYFLLVMLTTVFAVAPWIRHLRLRFKLRTVLVATTLVAIVLRLIVWATKS